MRIRVNRITAVVPVVLLVPIVGILRLVRLLTGRRRRLSYKNTMQTDPKEYAGPRPVVIALWAEWAAVWTSTTADYMSRLEQEFAGRCEFVYVDASRRSVRDAFGVSGLPVLIVRHHGVEVARFAHFVWPDDLRSALVSALEGSANAP